MQLRRSKLKREYGIVVKDEEAMPVGEKTVSDNWKQSNWICPHIYGGIPLASVEKIYPMVRDGPKYIKIEGLM